MPYQFDYTSYLSAVKTQPALSNDVAISNAVRNGRKFTNCKVDFKTFSKEYSSHNWRGRKVLALPAALIAGVVKTTYHLVKFILIGIPTVFFGKTDYIKAYTFTIIRDLQESFGFFICIFNDKYGSYHIQESLFQKSCYDCFLTAMDSEENNFSIAETAETSLEKGDLENTFKLAKEIDSSYKIKGILVRSTLFVKLADAYLKKGDLDNTLKAAKELSSSDKNYYGISLKAEFHTKVADAYLQKGELEMAKKIILAIPSQEDIYLKLADAYFKKGDVDGALELVPRSELGRTLSLQIAEIYFQKGKLKKAVESIAHLVLDEAKNSFGAKVAEACLQYDLEDARMKIPRLDLDTKTKELFISQIVEKFIDREELSQAEITITCFLSPTETSVSLKESLFVKLANAYINHNDFGNLGMATDICNKFLTKQENKDEILAKIKQSKFEITQNRIDLTYINDTQELFDENEDKAVLAFISLFIMKSFKNKIERDYPGAVMPLDEDTNPFFAKLAEDCYPKVKADFQARQPAEAIAKIKQMTIVEENVTAYLQLGK